MISLRTILYSGISILVSSCTNLILSSRLNPFAFAGILIGIAMIGIHFIGKNQAGQNSKNTILLVGFSFLTGLYISFYFQLPTENKNLFLNYRYIYFITTASLIIFLCRQDKISGESFWKSFAKKTVSSPFLFLFIPLFILSTISKNYYSSYDTNGATLIPFSIEHEGNLDITEFYGPYREFSSLEGHTLEESYMVISQLSSGKYIEHEFFIVVKDDKFLPAFPLIPAFYNTIFYFGLKLLGVEFVKYDRVTLRTETDRLYLERFSAAALACITTLLLFKLLSRYFSARTALVSTLVYAMGTTHFSNSSQTLWQHGFIEFLVVVSLTLLLNKNLSPKLRYSAIGFVLGTFFFVRPPSILLAGTLGIPLVFEIIALRNLKESAKLAVSFFAGIVATSSLFGGINYLVYDHPMGGYDLMNKAFALAGRPNLFTNPLLEGASGLLVSPSFGLFVFSPFLLFSLAGLAIPKRNFKILFLIIPIAFIGYLCVFGSYFNWWGGRNYGTRFLTDLMPLFALLTASSLRLIRKIRWLKFIFIPLTVVSIWAQTSGIFLDEPFTEWAECNKIILRDRLWDWGDIPYVKPFEKFFPLVTGKLDFNPAKECHIGNDAGEIEGRNAYRFGSRTDLFFLSESLFRDKISYLRQGHYCIETYIRPDLEKSDPNAYLQISFSQGKTQFFERKYSHVPDVPDRFEIDIPNTGKTKINFKTNEKFIFDFAGFLLKKGVCKTP